MFAGQFLPVAKENRTPVNNLPCSAWFEHPMFDVQFLIILRVVLHQHKLFQEYRYFTFLSRYRNRYKIRLFLFASSADDHLSLSPLCSWSVCGIVSRLVGKIRHKIMAWSLSSTDHRTEPVEWRVPPETQIQARTLVPIPRRITWNQLCRTPKTFKLMVVVSSGKENFRRGMFFEHGWLRVLTSTEGNVAIIF